MKTIKALNRVQIGLALMSSVAALGLAVLAVTVAPSLGCVSGFCGLCAAVQWYMCD